jgi:protein required for attachment to host cells
MGPVFIVIADSVRARIYDQQARGAPLNLVTDMAHPASGLHNQDLVTDKPGAVRSGNTSVGFAGAHPSPKEQEQTRFAHDIARHIEHARASGRFKELVLVMGPRMLGQVKHGLSDITKGQIARVIESDIARLNDTHIAQHLRDQWFVSQTVFAR